MLAVGSMHPGIGGGGTVGLENHWSTSSSYLSLCFIFLCSEFSNVGFAGALNVGGFRSCLGRGSSLGSLVVVLNFGVVGYFSLEHMGLISISYSLSLSLSDDEFCHFLLQYSDGIFYIF